MQSRVTNTGGKTARLEITRKLRISQIVASSKKLAYLAQAQCLETRAVWKIIAALDLCASWEMIAAWETGAT